MCRKEVNYRVCIVTQEPVFKCDHRNRLKMNQKKLREIGLENLRKMSFFKTIF